MGEQGQGHETTIAQIVASQTGIPFDKITVIHGDTLPTPYGFGTGSSRSSVVLMPSAWVAGKLMRDKILGIAGRLLSTAPHKLEIGDGKVFVKENHDKSVAVMEIVRTAYGAIHLLPENMEPGLEVTGYFINPNIDYTPDEKGRMNTFSSYPYAAVIAVVDVDIETGMKAETSKNPDTALGQNEPGTRRVDVLVVGGGFGGMGYGNGREVGHRRNSLLQDGETEDRGDLETVHENAGRRRASRKSYTSRPAPRRPAFSCTVSRSPRSFVSPSCRNGFLR